MWGNPFNYSCDEHKNKPVLLPKGISIVIVSIILRKESLREVMIIIIFIAVDAFLMLAKDQFGYGNEQVCV